MKTPVALIIFKRPDTTERVFEAIRQAKPPKLLVIADGPRADFSLGKGKSVLLLVLLLIEWTGTVKS